MELSELKNFTDNPRTLTQKQHDLLKRDLLELGDLSGIVHDLNSGEIPGGNQRTKIFSELPNPKIIITEQFDVPTKTGTVALGYIEIEGEKYSYRQVRWTKKQCKKANIVANKAGGEWDFNILANAFEVDNLLDWGFEDWEFGIKEPKQETEPAPTIEQGQAKTHKCPQCGHEFTE
jgi:hypothetical protein